MWILSEGRKYSAVNISLQKFSDATFSCQAKEIIWRITQNLRFLCKIRTRQMHDWQPTYAGSSKCAMSSVILCGGIFFLSRKSGFKYEWVVDGYKSLVSFVVFEFTHFMQSKSTYRFSPARVGPGCVSCSFPRDTLELALTTYFCPHFISFHILCLLFSLSAFFSLPEPSLFRLCLTSLSLRLAYFLFSVFLSYPHFEQRKQFFFYGV